MLVLTSPHSLGLLHVEVDVTARAAGVLGSGIAGNEASDFGPLIVLRGAPAEVVTSL